MTDVAEHREPETKRTVDLCMALDPNGYRCGVRAVMRWFNVPFCTQHCPPKRPGAGGWVRI